MADRVIIVAKDGGPRIGVPGFPIFVQSTDVAILTQVLIQLKKMELHLSKMSGLEISDDDITID